jgi:pimeloyl-ACP methyl ester carboxylesterase
VAPAESLIGSKQGSDARLGLARLRDGRLLAYAEWGPIEGRPLLHCHGLPDGRFGWGGGSACADRGVRLISIDRPGVGASDPSPGRSVADWTADVEDLAKQLELDRFSVSGWSAGGAYALACASKLGPRVDSTILISACGRLDLPGFIGQMSSATAWRLAARTPRLMTLTYSAMGRLGRRSPRGLAMIASSGLADADRAVICRPDVTRRMATAYVEATRSGGRGFTEDMQALLRPWGFEPAEIDFPVHLIHGRRDRVAPPSHAEHWIATLRASEPSWIEDAGHFLIEDHIDQILETLAS